MVQNKKGEGYRMICLILLMMLSCQSTNYYEMAGIKNELFTRREGTRINDFINNRAIDRALHINMEEQSNEWEEGWEKSKEKEVTNMESDFNTLITTITSAIAGVYCAVKAIIMFIKKIKK